MTIKAAELNHLFRALQAPAAARGLPKLAERAREEEWSQVDGLAMPRGTCRRWCLIRGYRPARRRRDH